MKKIFIAVLVGSVALFAACTKKASPAKVVVKTNYNIDIVPLLQARCTPCHLPSQKGFKANFENYESAKKYAADMVTRIQLNPGDKGFMPFKHAKLAEEEIAVFKKWVADGLLEK
ncbi:MAG: hypothetical protein IPL84_14330 [Chitinophagaceae bacterium]|nr:hypothetical protein [Chitinophagaceae bacterium]